MGFNEAERKVLEVLRNNPSARKDDYILINAVLKEYLPIDSDWWNDIDYIFTHHKELGLPSLETITRYRRKIQRAYPELADDKIQLMRNKKQEEFIQYAHKEIMEE